MKKWFVLSALAFCVALIATACGGGQEEAQAPTAVQAPTAAAPGEPVTPDIPDEGYIWSGTITLAPYLFGPIDPERNVIHSRIEEILRERHRLDVTLDVQFVEFTNYNEIINVRIAGGTAPDIFIGMGAVRIAELYRQAAIASWDRGLFEAYAPNITAFINSGGTRGGASQQDIDTWWFGSQVEGRMVTFPGFTGQPAFATRGIVYRADWLDNLGVPRDNIPHQLDEWVELMYRFANEDPAGDGRQTFGFGNSMIRYIFTAHGVFPNFLGGFGHWYYDQEAGRVRNAVVHPVNREVLELLQRLYADNIIDPEFITTEHLGQGGHWAISRGFINGLFGITGHGSFDHWRPREILGDTGGIVAQEFWAINGADAEFVFGPFPTGPQGYRGYFLYRGLGLGEAHVLGAHLNNDPDKLRAILMVMDAFASDYELAMLTQFGIEGEHYERDAEGTPVNLGLTPEERNAIGINTLRGLIGVDRPYMAEITEYQFFRNPVFDHIMHHQSRPYFDSMLQTAIMSPPPSLAIFQEELNAYRNETWIDIIRGALPVDYYDTFVDEWMRRGGQLLEDEANEIWLHENS